MSFSPRDQDRAVQRKKPRYPWIALILLLVSIYVFWILPLQLGNRPVQVEFAGSTK